MDWAKSKSILIATLIVLNIFLLLNVTLLGSDNDISDETVANTVKILETRGVSLQCEIPRLNTDPGKLTFSETSPFNRQEIAGLLLGKANVAAEELENGKELANGSKRLIFVNDHLLEYTDSQPTAGVDISEAEKAEVLLKEYLSRFHLPSDKFYLDIYSANPDGSYTAIYREKYRNYVVFENYLEITADKNGILSLKCGYKNLEDLLNPGPAFISAYQILLKEYSGVGGPEISTNIDFGFKDSNPEEDIKEMYKQPAWRIRTQDGKERFFKATNGEEIT